MVFSLTSWWGGMMSAQIMAEGTGAPTLVERKAGSLRLSIPATSQQKILWFEQQRNPLDPNYNVVKAFRLDVPVSGPAFRQSIRALVERHPILDTRLVARDGIPFLEQGAWNESAGIEYRHVEGSLDQAIEEEASRNFDLAQGPLFRAVWFKTPEEGEALALCLHHVITDFWSLTILLKDWARTYKAYAEGTHPSLETAPPSFIDYACRQGVEAAVPGCPSSSPEPLFSLRAEKPGRGKIVRQVLDPLLTRSLKAMAHRTGGSLPAVLMAAFQGFLGRLTDREKITVGLACPGRFRRSRWASTVGNFAKVVPVHAALGDFGLEDLVEGARRQSLEALRQRPGTEDGPSGQPEAAFAFQRFEDGNEGEAAAFVLEKGSLLKMDGLCLESLNNSQQVGTFRLLLVAHEEASILHLHWLVAEGLAEVPEPELLAPSFDAFLRAALAEPSRPVWEMPVLTASQRPETGESPQAILGSRAVHQIFEEKAAISPDATALVWKDSRQSYDELNRRANQWARLLKSRALRPGDLVGFCLRRGPEMPAVVLGILKAGAAYLPLDPETPAERLQWMVKDSGCRLLFMDRDSKTLFESNGQTGWIPPVSLVAEEVADELGEFDGTNLGVEVGFADLAYVIYTSGSTGKPKGVLLEHGGLIRLMESSRDYFGLSERDCVLQFASPGFDASVWEMFTALGSGARLLLVPQEARLDPIRLHGLMAEAEVTLALLPPALWQLLPEAGLPMLRNVVSGGEACGPDLVRRWSKVSRLVNAYGPTEATVISTWWECAPEDSQSAPPIGLPLHHVEAWVLNSRLQPVLPGFAGELCVGGQGLARGYLNRPALDAEKFIANPQGGGRLYRTGDRVCQRPDGALTYLGRIDRQVKVRGVRIEPGEIEAALMQEAGVAQAVVTLKDGKLVGYVAGPDCRGRERTLRRALKAKMPSAQVPSALVWVDQLPLSVNGKVDLSALPSPDFTSSEDNGMPQGPAESAVAAIFSQVLRLETVPRKADFFDLGGHSLMAAQVLARLETAFGRRPSFGEFFRNPTVSGVAESLAGVEVRKTRTPCLQKKAGRRMLSHAQEQLWLMDRISGNHSLYNLPVAVELEGPVQPEGLAWALGQIVRRHEPLRTSVREIQGRPRAVAAGEALIFQQKDLSGLEADERGRILDQELAAAASKPFDLSKDCLLRGHWFKSGDESSVLCLVLHHIAADGWSIGVLFSELQAFYRGWQNGQPFAMAPLTQSYSEFASLQKRSGKGHLARGLAFWKGKLDQMPGLLNLPADRPRPALPNQTGGSVRLRWPVSLVDKLKSMGRQEHATLHQVLLASFHVLLARLSGQKDFGVGTVVGNRPQAGLEGLIGYFVNPVVIRSFFADPAEGLTFRQLVVRSRQSMLEALEHGQVRFEKVVEALRPDRVAGVNPLFQALLVVQNAPPAQPSFGAASGSFRWMESFASKMDLTLSVEESSQGLEGRLEYSRELFEHDTVERFAGLLKKVLEAMADTPDLRVDDLELASWETAVVEGPVRPLANTAIHEIFQAQVDRTPLAPALLFGEEHWSYSGLNAKADGWARRLVQGGIEKGSVVGICLPRGPEMVAALMGVLKAGAVYLPLDPAYPQGRLEFMLDDSEAMGLIDSNGYRKLRGLVRKPAEGTACLIYTSGSTGTPKGVQVSHRSLVNHAMAMAQEFGMQPGDRMLQFVSFSFDAFGEELYPVLVSGAGLVFCADPASLAGLDLMEFCTRQRITHLHLPAAFWHQTVAELRERKYPPRLFPHSLRMLLVGGEAPDPALLSEWFRISAGRTLFLNAYGPTEATITATCYRLAAPGGEEGALPIGRPLANVRAMVLDERDRPVPVGVEGELYLAGAGLSMGYWKQPELTGEKFRSLAGGRWYRTGDRVKQLRDGNLLYLGRRDHQVKIRGFRVELGEVEAWLQKAPGVRRAVSAAQADGAGNQRLVAWVEAEDSSLPGIRSFLESAVPSHLRPSLLAPVERLPSTSNGKLDRKALPKADSIKGIPGEVPSTALEVRLAKLWERLLGFGPVGATDNFFELGGHSLLAVRLMAGIRDLTGKALPVSALLQAGTVRGLAALLEGRSGPEGSPSCLVAIKPSGSWVPFFCVHAVGGEVLSYELLGRHVRPEQPLYGLKAAGLDGGPLDPDLPSMAARYVAEIRGIQPQGPYLLGGWCGGGLLAFEMARQLALAGQEVARVVLLDTSIPESPAVTEPDQAALVRMFLAELKAGRGDFSGASEEEAPDPALIPAFRVFCNNFLAMSRYRPAARVANMILFRASEMLRPGSQDLGCGRLAKGNLEIQGVPGDHYSMLKVPNAAILAERLQVSLLEALPMEEQAA
jgi:amino acid adenylation domain-containing protein